MIFLDYVLIFYDGLDAEPMQSGMAMACLKTNTARQILLVSNNDIDPQIKTRISSTKIFAKRLLKTYKLYNRYELRVKSIKIKNIEGAS